MAQCNITLNTLCPCCQNPKLSAQEALHGAFSFDATPMVPPGTKCCVHANPQSWALWDLNAIDVYYVRPALKHYWCSHTVILTLVWNASPTLLPFIITWCRCHCIFHQQHCACYQKSGTSPFCLSTSHEQNHGCNTHVAHPLESSSALTKWAPKWTAHPNHKSPTSNTSKTPHHSWHTAPTTLQPLCSWPQCYLPILAICLTSNGACHHW